MTKDNNQPDAPEQYNQQEFPEVEQELSKVATDPKKNIVLLVGLIGALGYLAFTLFASTETTNSNDTKIALAPKNISKPADSDNNDIPAIPQLPEPPQIETPQEAPPPPLLPTPEIPKSPDGAITPPQVTPVAPPLAPQDLSVPAPPSSLSASLPPKLIETEDDQKRKMAKRKAAIVLLGNNQQKKTPEQIEQEADFKLRGNMDYVLGQGKIIDAVLESAIISEINNEIRALITRDVFSESGSTILIPKGSRIFGTFAGKVDEGYGRADITWNKINLQNGYTINFGGLGVDNLGRKGTSGRIDKKYKERIANSILTSAFNIALAQGLDKLVTPTTNNQAATQKTNSATQINNLTSTISLDATKTPQEKISTICAQIPSVIEDKTTTAYTQVTTACTTAISSPTTADKAQVLQALIASINAATSALITTAVTQATPTQAQEASKTAFKDISETIKTIATEHEFKPVVTIDQGTPIKIYVNKDYKFPKAAVTRSRMLE